MSVEALKSVFDIAAVVLLFLTFVAGAGVLVTGNIINRRQADKLQQFDLDMTKAKTELGEQQERAAKAEGHIASAEQHAAEANAKAEEFRLDIAKANEGAARANEAAEQERLARVKIEERLGGWKLSADAEGRVIRALKPFAGTHFSLFANPVEQSFVNTIDRILQESGWVRETPLDNDGNPATVLLDKKALVNFSTGLSILVSRDKFAELATAAAAYKEALIVEGLDVKLIGALSPASKIAPTVLKIQIGKRE